MSQLSLLELQSTENECWTQSWNFLLHQNRTLFRVFALNDLLWPLTLIPEHPICSKVQWFYWPSLMVLALWVLICKTSSILSENYLLTSSDLSWPLTKKIVIEFSHCLVITWLPNLVKIGPCLNLFKCKVQWPLVTRD